MASPKNSSGSKCQLEQGIESAYEDAVGTLACNMMDAAALEGVQAFLDKRPPSWRLQ